MSESERTFVLHSPFSPAGDQPGAIAALVTGLEEGLNRQVLLGVTGSGKTFTLANVIASVQKPTLILAPNKTLAAQLYGEMRAFFPENAVEYFVSYYDYYQPEAYVPSTDTFIEKDASINEQIEQMRLSATKALLERTDVILVATVSAIYGLGDPEAYKSMRLVLLRGQRTDLQQMLRRLAEMQYNRNDLDLQRGTYRVRGDVVDIFPADAETQAVRIEFFGNEIERILNFDPLTGEVLDKLETLILYPKTHYVTPRARVLDAMEKIKVELKSRLEVLRAENKGLEAQRLEQRTQYDIEMLNELGYCNGIENYSRLLTSREPGMAPPTLLDYLPAGGLLVLDESHAMIPQLKAMYRGDRSRKETLVNYGFRLPSALDNRPLTFEEFETIMPQTIFVSATPAEYELVGAQQVVEQIVRPTGLIDPTILIRPVATQVDDLLSEIKRRTALDERVLITTLTKRMAENLTDYYIEQGIRVRYLHSDIQTMERTEILQGLRRGDFDVLVGINLLREGLDIPEVSLVAILDADREGFLRSARSIMQTIGRAARHIHGEAILYADRITPSIRQVMEEVDRRRLKQVQFNTDHGITPQGIQKAIQEVLRMEAPTAPPPKVMTPPEQIARQLKKLEKDMHRKAENLEFEAAAKLRDEIKILRESLIFGS